MDAAVDLTAIPPNQQSRWRYRVVSEDLYRLESGKYHTYGIQLETSGCADTLHDISVCKKTAEHMVELLNHYQVSPIHLYDVVTDMLP